MPSPDLTEIERIEGLLRGMPPETEREAALEGLIRELRISAPAVPASVRERVRALEEPRPRPRPSWRPALIALPLALAMVAGAVLLGRGGRTSGGDEATGGGQLKTLTTAGEPLGQYSRSEQGEVVHGLARVPTPTFGPLVPPTVPDRAQEWDVSMELRVPDNDRLGEASADAIRTTRELGGYVVSSSVGTQGKSGEAQLVIRVPVRRIQDAIARLSALGTITGQRVSIQDRQDELDRLARRLDSLRIALAEVKAELARTDLSAAERLRLELRRARLGGELNRIGRQRRAVSREVALADISLALRTGESAAPPREGRVGGAARDAVHVLAVAGAVTVFLLIVLSPLLAVAALALFARRVVRRRTEERLLEQPRPAAARE